MESSVVVVRQTLDAERMGFVPTLVDLLTTTGR